MIVRIRFDLGRKRTARARSNRQFALAFAALLSPLAFVAFALGAWSLFADFGWAGAFGIEDTIFARWQTWIIISMLLHFVALGLNRYGSNHNEASIP